MVSEAQRSLNFLAAAGPLANTTVTGDVLDEMMESCGGQIMARGILYNLKTKKLSPKMWKVSLERAN